jgi:hypothetical protein
MAAVLFLCAGAGWLAVAMDGIAFRNLNGEAVVLVDGKRGSKCWRDRLFVASAPLVFGTITATNTCPSEVNLFAAEGGMLWEKNPAWSHDPADPLVLTVRAPRTVQVNVVVVPGNVANANAWVQTAMDEMNTFLADNRTGLQVAPSTFRTATSDQADLIGNGCEGSGELKETDPAEGIYDPARINMYFVPWIDMLGYGMWLGYNCYEPNQSGGRAPNILFVSLLYGVYPTATHELGHALGLRWLAGHTNPGSQDGRHDFPVTNLMYSNVDRQTAAAQTRLSLGQAYRMNVDSASWLNRPGQQAAPAMQRNCQPDPTTSKPCPRLALDLPSP